MTDERTDGWATVRAALVDAATVDGVGPEPADVERFAAVLTDLDDGAATVDETRERLTYVVDEYEPDHVETFEALGEGRVDPRRTVLRAGVADDPGDRPIAEVLEACGLASDADATLRETLNAADEAVADADRVGRSLRELLDDAELGDAVTGPDALLDRSAGVLFSGVLDEVDEAAAPLREVQAWNEPGMPGVADSAARAVYDAYEPRDARRVERAARELTHAGATRPVEPALGGYFHTFRGQVERDPGIGVTADELDVAARLTLERPSGVEPEYPNPTTGTAPPRDTIDRVLAAGDAVYDEGVEYRADDRWAGDERTGLTDWVAERAADGGEDEEENRDGDGLDPS